MGMRQRDETKRACCGYRGIIGSYMIYMPIESYYILKQYMSRAILFEHDKEDTYN
jgi:hypothetical protein